MKIQKILIIIFLIFTFSSVYAQYINDIMIVIENLRLRESDNVNSNIITTMNKDSFIKILRIGKEDVVNGIKSYWYLVEVQSNVKNNFGEQITEGIEGWCFGGYLKSQTDYYIENLDIFLNLPFESFDKLINDEEMLVSLLGKIYTKEIESEYWWIWEKNVVITTYIFDGIIIDFIENSIDSITITNPLFKLNKNINIGMTKNDIRFIFGDGLSKDIPISSNATEIVSYSLSPELSPNGSNTVDFYFINDKLTKIYWYSFIP